MGNNLVAAGRLSSSLCGIRSKESGEIHGEEESRVAEESRDHPQPAQNRLGGDQRASVSHGTGGIRFIRSLYLAVCRWETESESLGTYVAGSRHEPCERRIVEGSQESWFPVCRQHDRLCLHAGGWI